jgi:hypothetical protein
VRSELRGRVPSLGAAAALLLSACTPFVPPTATRLESAPGPTAPAATAGAVTATPQPSAVDPASIELHYLDPGYVPGDVPVSAAGQVLWAAGEKGLPEVWRYLPGSAAPERIFRSPRPHSLITSVVGSTTGYAFVEESEAAFGEGGWRVWYLAGPGAEPVELVRGVAKEAGFPPTLAMDDARVAWAGFDEPATGFVSRLGVAEIADIDRPQTLLERPIDQSLLWYPCLSGDELWYGTIAPNSDPTAIGPEYTLEMLDLSDPQSSPVPFGGHGHDFNPAVDDRYLVWKANVRGDAALNWGTLEVLDRRTQAVRTIPVDHANRPTLGSRYVAFDEILHARLAVYDLATGTVLDLAAEGSGLTYAGETLSGNLLTFSAAEANGSGKPRIGWAILPE